MTMYSTGQVARKIGIDKKTLLRWLYAGKIFEPDQIRTPTATIRIWTERDLKRVIRFKEQNYRKGRGRKKAV
jgi:predicted site-specific integrase-resolvase